MDSIIENMYRKRFGISKEDDIKSTKPNCCYCGTQFYHMACCIKIGNIDERNRQMNHTKYFEYVFCNYTQGSFKGYSNKILNSIKEERSWIPKNILKRPLEIFLVTKNKIKSGKFTAGDKLEIINSNITTNNTKNTKKFKIINKNTNSIIFIQKNIRTENNQEGFEMQKIR